MSSPSPGKRRMDTDVVKLRQHREQARGHHPQRTQRVCGQIPRTSWNCLRRWGLEGASGPAGEISLQIPLDRSETVVRRKSQLFSTTLTYPFVLLTGFMNKIFHPNIDEASGTVCLDVINQTWTALYDLTNIFESFLPQLLAYPNPIDPLNGDAAALYLHQPEDYKHKIKEYIQRYATEEALKEQEEAGGDSSSESSMSDFSEDEAQDMEL
ncbi:unnamed protein product, partial [Tetraodon nigroviridis]